MNLEQKSRPMSYDVRSTLASKRVRALDNTAMGHCKTYIILQNIREKNSLNESKSSIIRGYRPV